MNRLLSKIFEGFLHFQRRYAFLLLLLSVVLSVATFPRAVGLLTNIKTDLITLLPSHYPSVHYTKEIQKKFNRRSSMYLILNSPDKEANFKAMQDVRAFLLREMDSIDFIQIDKKGYDFLNKNKLLLIDLKDIYTLHDRLKDKIQKKKLGGLYIDFEEDVGADSKKEVSFDDIVDKYKDEFTEGVGSRYKTNKDGSVYVLNIYPKDTNASLGFFKKFGSAVQDKVTEFDFKAYHPELKYGYAGAIITRVDQYTALIDDLKKAGLVSALSIFLLLYFYFGRLLGRKPGVLGGLIAVFVRAIPVVLIFLPMITSTFVAFWFCSFFFSELNVVTSFLFAILFGLGVDIGIHLITRFIQDKNAGVAIEDIHRNVVIKTGKSCVVGIMTTVASFYVLTFTDFKGFSEFGWIAGNGLIIALIGYLVFFPCLLLLIDKLGILHFQKLPASNLATDHKKRWLVGAKPILAGLFGFTVLSVFMVNGMQFEWDFNKLKMHLKHREFQKSLLKQTHGRVNSPAVYLVENEAQARKVRQVIRQRKELDTDFDTIQFNRSYYDLVPYDQDEKLAVLKDIDDMLSDDAMSTVSDDEKRMVKDLRKAIAKTKKIEFKDVPKDIYGYFWGDSGATDKSVSYVAPLPHLELDNGNNAKAFYEDVYDVKALGHQFYALSDAIIFAEVLQTLFKDAKRAVILASLVILLLLSLHFKNAARVAVVMVCLTCGIVWMLGLMAIFDFRLNFYNMIIIPAIIGMGVDNSVHIVHRFDEVGRRSIRAVLRTSGGAALMASLTTVLGYSGMLVTRHPGLQSIGWMAVIGMGTCLMASLVLLPVMLQLFLRHEDETDS